MIRVASFAILLLLVGCASGNQRMVARAAVPDDTFDCYLRVLAEMEYRRRADTDRSLGFIRAVKENAPLPSSRSRTPSGIEVTVTIAPASKGGGSDVSLDIYRVIMNQSGEVRRARRRIPFPLPDGGWQDLDTLSEACAPLGARR